jgi:hypothetical protein
MTTRDWWAMTIKKDPTDVEWDMNSGEVRARDQEKTNWVYGHKVPKAEYALHTGYRLLWEAKNGHTTLPVPHVHGRANC